MRTPRGIRVVVGALAGALVAAVTTACSGPAGSSGAAGADGAGTPSLSVVTTPAPTGTPSLTPPPAPSRPVVDLTRPGTVLLVPGYGGNVADLDALRDLLESRGRTVVQVRMPGNGTGDLREEAKAVKDAADAALAAGAPSVDVVGYSAGGVIARVYLADLGGAAVTRRVVTIGSPHHGTTIAARAVAAGIACPQACRQLVPGSALLRSLPEPPTARGTHGPVFVSLWSSADEVIAPPTSSLLRGALSVQLQAVCPDDATTHVRLPRTPLVGGLVLRALAVRPLTAVPPRSQCETIRTKG